MPDLDELKENESLGRSSISSSNNTSDFMSQSSKSEDEPVRKKPVNYANPFANQIKFLENAAFESEQKQREQRWEEKKNKKNIDPMLAMAEAAGMANVEEISDGEDHTQEIQLEAMIKK